MLENIMQYQGFTTAFSGLLIVFSGLVLIALVIHSFNLMFKSRDSNVEPESDDSSFEKQTHTISAGLDVPSEHLIAIAAAVELYRRLHFDQLESKVTFERGELNPGWKVGYKFGQRYHTLR